MTQPVDLTRIDADLAELWREVTEARAIWEHAPGNDTADAVDEAEERFHLLLDFRYKATRQEQAAQV